MDSWTIHLLLMLDLFQAAINNDYDNNNNNNISTLDIEI